MRISCDYKLAILHVDTHDDILVMDQLRCHYPTYIDWVSKCVQIQTTSRIIHRQGRQGFHRTVGLAVHQSQFPIIVGPKSISRN